MNNHCRLWRLEAAQRLYPAGQRRGRRQTTEGVCAGEGALCGLEENWSIAGLRYGDADFRYGDGDLHVKEEAFKVTIGETRDDDGAYREERKPEAFGGEGQRHTDREHQGVKDVHRKRVLFAAQGEELRAQDLGYPCGGFEGDGYQSGAGDGDELEANDRAEGGSQAEAMPHPDCKNCR